MPGKAGKHCTQTQLCTHQELRKRLSIGRMYFGHHISAAGWTLLSLLNRDLLSSYKAKIKVYNQSRGKHSWHYCWHQYFSIGEKSLRSIAFEPMPDLQILICKYKLTYNISSHVSKLLSRITNSCKAWFTKPYIFTAVSRPTDAQKLISAKNDPAIIDLTLDTSHNRWATKNKCHLFCIIITIL